MYDLKVNKCTSTIAESQNVLRIEKDIYQFNIITNMCPKFFVFFFTFQMQKLKLENLLKTGKHECELTMT